VAFLVVLHCPFTAEASHTLCWASTADAAKIHLACNNVTWS